MCCGAAGRTLTDDEPLLEFLSEAHAFAPVAVGCSQPPVQSYELRNVSATEISYVVDLTPLETLKNDNYGFKVRLRWVTLRARWVTLRARWVTTLRARWVTLRARWVTDAKSSLGDAKSFRHAVLHTGAGVPQPAGAGAAG